MSERDRKDLPHPDDAAMDAHVETPAERIARKEKESDALDLALEETFPTSDPISPFVPAIPTGTEDSSARGDKRECAHEMCTCEVIAPTRWCSQECLDAQQGYATHRAQECPCHHTGCAHAHA